MSWSDNNPRMVAEDENVEEPLETGGLIRIKLTSSRGDLGSLSGHFQPEMDVQGA